MEKIDNILVGELGSECDFKIGKVQIPRLFGLSRISAIFCISIYSGSIKIIEL